MSCVSYSELLCEGRKWNLGPLPEQPSLLIKKLLLFLIRQGLIPARKAEGGFLEAREILSKQISL